MGAGKSTVGRRLARRLNRKFIDMDRDLSTATGRSITALFDRDGEAAFRLRESALLKQLAARRDGPVVATGGGIVLAAANRRLLARQFDCYWLDVSAAESWRRLRTATGRPLLLSGPGRTPLARLTRYARSRRPHYAAAGKRLIATGRSPDQIMERIVQRFPAG